MRWTLIAKHDLFSCSEPHAEVPDTHVHERDPMKLFRAAPVVAAFAMTAALPATAQTTNETKVSHDTSMHDGVATTKTKVVHTRKHKTHRAKRILGVKVGHKTRTTKTVRETTRSSNGDVSTSVKTSH